MDKIENLLKGVQKNISLVRYNTFKVGGQAKYFYIAKDKNGLIKATGAADKLNLPFFILGNGSNLLIADKGFNGLVIKMQNNNCRIRNFEISAGAGTKLGELLDISVKNNLAGLEWAAGIPGTVGGAIYGNAGAFGSSMADFVCSIEILDLNSKKIIILKNKNCKFGYRKSVFQDNKNWIIVSAEILLKKDNKKNIKNKIKEFLDNRKKTQPLNFPSAGSIFKNPKIFSAGELIEKCNLKGKKIGGAMISEKHANFIINYDGAKAGDIKKLINFVKKSVKNKFKIILEEEIKYLGF
jgi:UDP-N-acetylmuramate dehydrogenase